jgi:hypothetical protein
MSKANRYRYYMQYTQDNAIFETMMRTAAKSDFGDAGECFPVGNHMVSIKKSQDNYVRSYSKTYIY